MTDVLTYCRPLRSVPRPFLRLLFYFFLLLFPPWVRPYIPPFALLLISDLFIAGVRGSRNTPTVVTILHTAVDRCGPSLCFIYKKKKKKKREFSSFLYIFGVSPLGNLYRFLLLFFVYKNIFYFHRF